MNTLYQLLSLSSRDVPPVPSIEAVLEKTKDAVYKRGVRTTEFFRDTSYVVVMSRKSRLVWAFMYDPFG